MIAGKTSPREKVLTKMKNVLIFSKNYENYVSGYYHQDIIDAFTSLTNVLLYGPGYINYSKKDTFCDVLFKLDVDVADLDLIVFSTSWDEDGSTDCVDPHPRIEVGAVDIPKVYFLNKEYKKLDLRFEYIKKQKISLVSTVHPSAEEWQAKLNIPFFHLPFGISLDRFKDFGLAKKYDFSFTGGLHASHTDMRFNVKKQLFKDSHLATKSNKGLSGFLRSPLKEEFEQYKIFWGEWGARNYLGRSILPTGAEYGYFMNQSKVFLNTPSALGVFNTRFFELMATKSLILCPEDSSYGSFLHNQVNCLMFKPDLSDFKKTLTMAIEDDALRECLVANACDGVKKHSYENRIIDLLDRLTLI